ncbi:MAG: cob(I)yrinic acid a,c-diamide adenosyltransferase [Bacteroidales bacterium]|nr:cob(I)yrinic acid a,c-diamide adenosyltransferase [Bacteroidales bacterium]
MKVYTLTGDKGTTALVGGQRVDKDCTRVEAYGTIDELNAHIGLLACHLRQSPCGDIDKVIFAIQNKLFNIGGYLATDGTDPDVPVYGLDEADVRLLEERIDAMEAPFRGFILPGGCLVSAQCEVCRTVARRAERRIVTLAKEVHVAPLVLQYINRLSDFFFTLARHANATQSIPETYWTKNQ